MYLLEIGGIIDYLMAVIGLDFSEIGDLSPAQIIIVLFGCVVAVYVLLFIIRAVLGAVMHQFR